MRGRGKREEGRRKKETLRLVLSAVERTRKEEN
jgi:hypothetical protein